MSIESCKTVLIFLLSSIGLIALPLIGHVPQPISLFFYLLLAWRFLGIWNRQWLPGTAAVFLLTIGGAVLLYLQHQGILGRDAGTNILLAALALKLMELKKERDIYLVICLAFILAASQFLYEQTLLMAAYILAVCCLLLASLVAITDSNKKNLQALKIAGTIIFQALPFAIVIFILFPRVDAPKWLMMPKKNQTLSGLNDYLEPGSISDLGMSDELVFRVKFSGNIPPPHLRYWRGPVMTHTDGKRWTPRKKRAHRQNTKDPTVSGQAYRYTLLMEPQEKNWVFGLDLPVGYSENLKRNSNYQLITSANPEKRTEYQLLSYSHYNTGPLLPKDYQEAVQLPGGPSGQIKKLVRKLRGFDSPPEKYVKQVLKHFRTENFRYTLTPPLLERKPIETFLFETRSGFCSHYASAFVYLMRAAGIPSRIVTGYQGGELNEIGHFLEIRQSDAHAWAEVWLNNLGWIRIDPTAAVAPERIERNVDVDRLVLGGEVSFVKGSIAAQFAIDMLRQAGQIWNHVDYNWQRWVINYNTSNQSRFLSSFGIHDIKAMVYWMSVIITVMTAVFSTILFIQKPEAADQALTAYKKYCRKLEQNGLRINLGEGASAFAERAKNSLPEHSADIDRITFLFIKLRYGRDSTGEDLKRLISLISAFKI
ncbi:MAG: transglutaminase TgpA family protein [Gammaproteobacteria bacterium]